MAEDDYELMPREEITELRKELRKLKGSSSPGINLNISMEKLSANIEELLLLIRDASRGVKEEQGPMMLAVQDVVKDVRELKEQNKRIAEAILAVADMIKKPAEKKPEPSPFDNQPGFGGPIGGPQPAHGGPLPPPGMGPMPPAAPMPGAKMPPQGIPPPPGPMPPPKKRGFFGR